MIRVHRLWLLVFAFVLACLAAPSSEQGHVLASGKLAQGDPLGEGYFVVGEHFTVLVPPQGIQADVLREHLGAEVEIVIRRRELQRIQR